MEIAELMDYYWNQNIDQRTKDLTLVSSNYLIPSIVIAYLYIVLKWGPEYMKHKQPYNLKTFVRIYNIAQVITNAYLIRRFLATGTINEFKICHIPDYSLEPAEIEVAYVLWMTLMSRLIDFVETVVFVFRKKDRQVSFLHLYHHIGTLMIGWYFTRFYAVRMTVVPVMLNCAVHVIMYSYYFLSSLDKPPKMLKTMKQFITIIQLVQLVLILMWFVAVYLPSCPVPRTPANIQLVNIGILCKLFYDFYQENYKTQKKQKS